MILMIEHTTNKSNKLSLGNIHTCDRKSATSHVMCAHIHRSATVRIEIVTPVSGDYTVYCSYLLLEDHKYCILYIYIILC